MYNSHLRIVSACSFLLIILLLQCSCHHNVGVIAFAVSAPLSLWRRDAPAVRTALDVGNIFDGLGRFFSSDKNENDDSDENNNDNNDDDDDYDSQVGSTCLVSLQVESLKPGGLRLFLMFYLLGIQNNPEKGTWKIDQPTGDEYIVDLYFHDKTGALMLRLTEDKVTIDRLGSTPSTAYIMQEAVVVDGILAEMERMASDPDIKRDDRLILLNDDTALRSAREALAFG